MENPTTPQKSPYKVIIGKGKTYFWCVCGLSQKQPFCERHHKKEKKFKSIKYLAEESKEMFFCKWKMTKHQPFCDGSHSKS